MSPEHISVVKESVNFDVSSNSELDSQFLLLALF